MPDEPFLFEGFFENAFDRYLVLNKRLTPFSNITHVLNRFDGGVGKTYANQFEFIEKFTKSRAYKVAVQMLELVRTPETIGFMPKGGKTVDDLIILETGIKEGYVPGSSISHFDYRIYTNTSDFLMRYLHDPGVLLEEDIKIGGNYSGGAIGPLTLRCLETLGYRINQNPKPIAMYQMEAESSAAHSWSTLLDGFTRTYTALLVTAVSMLAMLY
jgi:hypothetical protein